MLKERWSGDWGKKRKKPSELSLASEENKNDVNYFYHVVQMCM